MEQPGIKQLKQHVVPFEQADTKASIRQILNTLVPLVGLWCGAYFSMSISYWLALPLAVIAAGFLIRTFILQHDCGHYSFFKSRRANDAFGTMLGVLTMLPYQQWKNEHAIHHSTSGNLDKRGVGDLWLLTVEEYTAAPLWRRLAYRIYRNPFVMFGLGPIAVFLIQYRFNRKGARSKERLNTYMTNVLIVLVYGALAWLVGWQAFLLIQGPIFFLSGCFGIWLFYVQHTFEETYFEHDPEWSYVQAAVEGSSYYKLPWLLQWLTGNIGFHHVHHLSPKVPNYRLAEVHENVAPLQKATTITLGTSLKSLGFRLWDEELKAFVSFRELKRRRAAVKRKTVASAKRASGAANSLL